MSNQTFLNIFRLINSYAFALNFYVTQFNNQMNLNTIENLYIEAESTLDRLTQIKSHQRHLYKPTQPTRTEKYLQQNIINQLGQPLPLNVDNEYFKQYGIGLFLYFDFLKKMIIVMFLMGFVALVSAYFNLQQNGLSQFGQARSNFMLLSLANQPSYVYDSTLSVSQNNSNLKSFVSNAMTRMLKVSIPDAVYTVIFLIFLLYWNNHSSKIIKQYHQKSITPSKFTLQIYLKQDIRIYQQDLFNHFSKLGQVISIQLAYDYQGGMYKLKKIGEIIKQAKKNKILAEIHTGDKTKSEKFETQYRDNLTQLAETIKTNKSSFQRLKIAKGFLMLNNTETANNIYNMYRKYQFPFIQRICCFFCLEKKPEHLLYKGKDIFNIKKCKVEPSDVKWENLDISKTQFYCRAFIILLILLSAFFMIFFIIFLISLVSPNTYKTTNLQFIPTYEQVIASNDVVYKDLYCLSLSFATIISNRNIYNLCYDSLRRYYLQVLVNQVISLIIVIANIILSKIITKLSQFRRFKSKSQLAYQISLSQMTAMILNSSLLNILLQANIYNFVPTSFAYAILNNSMLSAYISTYPIYTDFTRSWYLDVGTKLTSMWLINIFVPHFMLFLFSPLIKKYRKWKSDRQFLQIEANHAILGSQFNLSYYFSFMLYTITVSLIFCGPMPYFLLIGSLSLTILYLSSKFHILRIQKKPPSYSEKLNELVLKVLPISILIHLLVSGYCYSIETIFPLNSETFTITVANTLQNIGIKMSSTVQTSNSDFDTILNRLMRIIYIVIIFCLVLFSYMFTNVILLAFAKFRRYCCENKVHNEKVNTYVYDQEISKLRKRMINDYNIENNDQYEQVEMALQYVKQSNKQKLSL